MVPTATCSPGWRWARGGWRLNGAGQLRSARSGGTVAAPERGRNDHEIHAHKGRLGEAGDDGEWEADPGHGCDGEYGITAGGAARCARRTSADHGPAPGRR